MISWQIGCSGFQYRHWKHIFYPDKLAQKNWFHYYSTHFTTVELNVTFYRFPDIKMVTAWYEKSAPGFVFTVKAPRIITHYKKLIDTESLVAEFYDTLRTGFKEKLGCVLFQFPPSYSYSEERLDKVIAAMDVSFNNVIEFRHNSWWADDVYKKLGENHITFCGMSHPLLPADIIHNNSVLYYRMHGVPHLYKSPYVHTELEKIVSTISKIRMLKIAYIYFNNDIDGSAVRNAKEMLGLT